MARLAIYSKGHMIRIVLTGAECTGKTTLAKALSGYYGAPWTGEFVRDYTAGLKRPLSEDDLEPIARGQLALEDSVLRSGGPLAIHDTNLFSSILYAKHYFDRELDWVNEAFLQRHYTLYLLCTPEGITWKPDPGQRESPEARERLQEKFRTGLVKLDLPMTALRGSQEARFGEAVLTVDTLLSP